MLASAINQVDATSHPNLELLSRENKIESILLVLLKNQALTLWMREIPKRISWQLVLGRKWDGSARKNEGWAQYVPVLLVAKTAGHSMIVTPSPR